MANKFWRGTAGDGDWSNTNNWASTRYGATGAGAPASNDDVYILDGSNDITAGLSAAATDLNSLTIKFAGRIGTDSAPLIVAVSGTSNATLTYEGTGRCKIQAGTNGIDILHVRRTGEAGFYLVGGTTAAVKCGAVGRLYVEAAAVISASLRSAGMNIEIADNATDIPTGVFDAGVIESRRDIDSVLIGPRAIYRAKEDVTVDTLAEVYGVFEHLSSGTIAKIIAHANSICRATGTQASGFTVTDQDIYEGARVFEDDRRLVTATNAPTYI